MQILLPYSFLLRLSLLVTLCLCSVSAWAQTGCNFPIAIQWVDLYGVIVASDNGLTKTVAAGWNAGAASQNGLEAGEGGWVEWTAGPAGNQYLAGLSYVNIDHNYGSLNFGIQYLGNGTVNLVENGSVKITLTAINESDVFRVERAGSEIRYLRNNGLIRSLPVDATKRMLADVSVHTGKTPTILASFCVPVKATASLIPANCGGSDGSISLNTFGGTPPYSYLWNDGLTPANRSGLSAGSYSVTVSDAAGGSIQYNYLVGSRSPWKDVVGVAVNTDNSLSRNSGSGWNAGAASVNFIEANQNGWVEWSSPAAGSKYVVGLSFTNPDAGFGSIAYGIYHDGSGNIHCLENNGTINNLAGDKAINLFRVERKDKSIYYYKNGTVVRTTALNEAQASQRMLVDVSLNTGQIPTLHLSFCNSFVWNGSVNSNWNNSANWTPNGVPGTGDYVTISAKPNHPVLDMDRSLNGLTFSSGNLNLSGYNLRTTGVVTISPGAVVSNGKLISQGSSITIGTPYNPTTVSAAIEISSNITQICNTVFNETFTLSITNPAGYQLFGGNTYNGVTTITNSGGNVTMNAG
jgi:hypothetical protein